MPCQLSGLFRKAALLVGMLTAISVFAAEREDGALRWHRPVDAFERSARSLSDQPVGLRYSEARVCFVDDPRFAEKDFDDRAWQLLPSFQELPSRTGVFWIRFRARMEDGATFDDGFQITGAASYRIFWDGHAIGQAGEPGASKSAEAVGPLDQLYVVPPDARGPGEHVIALRMSSYHNNFPGLVRLLCFSGTAVQLESKLILAGVVPVIAAAALCMLAISSWVLCCFGVRSPALTWFAAVCTFAALFQATLAARFVSGYPYTWAFPMILIRDFCMGAVGLSLVMFVSEHLSRRVRGWLLVGLIAIFAVIGGATYENPNMFGAYWITVSGLLALALAMWTLFQRRSWSNGLIVAGVALVAIFVLADPFAYSSTNFFLKFLPTELCLMGVLGVRVRNERRRLRDAQLHSARLEIELLKKNLQPHFLFNTLTAISEVIEQSPTSAVALIDDLAEEFRALTRLAGEKLIPLRQELDLCETHLRVVSRRMGTGASLRVTGPVEGLFVPPAVFLTLIENGFAHQAVAESGGEFQLLVAIDGDLVTLRFTSPGKVVAHTRRSQGGTGLRYLQARLEESFPGTWNFSHEATGTGWLTQITYRQCAVASATESPIKREADNRVTMLPVRRDLPAK